MNNNLDINFVEDFCIKHSICYSTNCTFSRLTTFKVGGKIAIVVYPDKPSKLIALVKLLTKHCIKHIVIGNGSNILASDSYYNGVVIVTKKLNKVTHFGRFVTAECGAFAPNVFGICCKCGLSGGEFLSTLPATMGGVVTMNAGCFGQEISQIAHSVTALINGKVVKLSNGKCLFGKRKSVFQSGGIVLSVTLKLRKGNKIEILHTANEMKKRKALTQPLTEKSAGSVFVSEDNVSIAKLVDDLGLKGCAIGGAMVSKKHAGFVVNIDKATPKDIYYLIQHISQLLLDNYNIKPRVEIKLVGFDEEK